MTPWLRRASLKPSLALIVIGLLTAGCGSDRDPLEIGLRRIALDLAFRDADKAPDVPPREVITQILPADFVPSVEAFEKEEQAQAVDAPTRRSVVRVPPPPPKRSEPCAVADPSATPDRNAFVVIKDPPLVGSYPRRNEGRLDITVATFNVKVPYPPSTVWDIPRVVPTAYPTAVGDRETAAVPVPQAVQDNRTASPLSYEFDIVRKAIPGFTVTDTYSYTYTAATGGDFLYLRKRVTVANGVTSEFVPSPPIRVVRLGVSPGGDGTTDSASNHGGVDRTSNVAMTIQSDVIGREEVDVCGEVVDTYVVQFQERVVDLSKTPPDVSGNEPDQFNRWNIQFDNGLLIVRETINTVTRTTVQALGAPVPVEIRANYTSTLRSIQPKPLGTPAPRVDQPDSEVTSVPADEEEGQE